MSNQLHDNTKITNTGLTDAFAKKAQTNALNTLASGVTWNGDINFDIMGNDFKSKVLELDQSMVTPQKCLEKTELDAETILLLNDLFDSYKVSTTSMSETERAMAWGLMFRYLYYVRSVRAAGKKSRLLFYYLFARLHTEFPQTCCALISLIPEFGYFGDLDVLITKMSHCLDVVEAALECYKKNLDADCTLLFGKPLADLRTTAETQKVKQINASLKTKSVAEIRAFVGPNRLSLAAKWFPREGKSGSAFRKSFLKKAFYPNGEIDELERISPNEAKTRMGYLEMLFRHVLSTLNQCLLTGESMMCEQKSEGRTWQHIPIAGAPAKFVTKYRKALANEDLKNQVPEYQQDTGNRYPEKEDRVLARRNLIKTLMEGKLKGAAQDIEKLSSIIYDHIEQTYDSQRCTLSKQLSVTERQVIAAQWSDLVAKLNEEITALIVKSKEEAEKAGELFLDPRNVIPIVDTSGSMGGAKVQHSAIGLGILGTSLSTMKGCLISFSNEPEVFHLDMSGDKDVFDHFLAIMNGPTGLSTNVDATYRLLLKMMVDSGTKETDFALMYLTDGQFDDQCYVPELGRVSPGQFQQTYVARLEKAFNDEGYNLPRTIFWNLNSKSPGFPVTSDMKGFQVVSGYSQTLMEQVFTGDYKYEVQADGSVKVTVDPWSSFLKALLNPAYDQVSQIVATTGEGCLKHLQK